MSSDRKLDDGVLTAKIKKQLLDLCDSMNEARSRGIAVNFHIGLTTKIPIKFEITQMVMTKELKP